jgi:hypothetical protein
MLEWLVENDAGEFCVDLDLGLVKDIQKTLLQL